MRGPKRSGEQRPEYPGTSTRQRFWPIRRHCFQFLSQSLLTGEILALADMLGALDTLAETVELKLDPTKKVIATAKQSLNSVFLVENILL